MTLTITYDPGRRVWFWRWDWPNGWYESNPYYWNHLLDCYQNAAIWAATQGPDDLCHAVISLNK